VSPGMNVGCQGFLATDPPHLGSMQTVPGVSLPPRGHQSPPPPSQGSPITSTTHPGVTNHLHYPPRGHQSPPLPSQGSLRPTLLFLSNFPILK
jgi:hypothetical protein